MASEENYVYLDIADALLAVNQKVNLMGVIVEHGLVEKSRGTDWFCSLKITDKSYQGRGLVVEVYAARVQEVPHVKSVGDIVRFSQVKMKRDRQKPYVSFIKNVSTYALFEGKAGMNFIPYQVSSSYIVRHPDKDFITSLRTWLLNNQLDSGSSEFVRSLKQIKKEKRFDVVCKVLKVFKVPDAWMVLMWDGTDAPPLPCRTKLHDELQNPLPLQFEESPLPKDLLCEFPKVGTVFRVFVYHTTENLALKLPCRWVRVIKLLCEEKSGLWYGKPDPFTKLRILSNEDITVTHRQREFERRFNAKWDRIPNSAFPSPSSITETDYEDVPFATLVEALTYPEVTTKFKCVARVVAICPWRVEDFRSPTGLCLYRIRVTLEDPTARIHAIIYGEDGEMFFGGYPSMDVLTCKRNRLVGIADKNGAEDLDAPRNPPWVQFCLKAYCLDDNDKWGTRKYRIFGTRVMTQSN